MFVHIDLNITRVSKTVCAKLIGSYCCDYQLISLIFLINCVLHGNVLYLLQKDFAMGILSMIVDVKSAMSQGNVHVKTGVET